MEKPKNFKEVARMWQARLDGKEELKRANVKCPKCATLYGCKLGDDWFICACGKIIEIDKCIWISESEGVH